MRLPRWTVYPALLVLTGVLLTAIPGREGDPFAGAAAEARGEAGAGPATRYERVVVLGIDGMDPEILAEVIELYPERMPNFRKLIEDGDGIHSLATSTPPQSPVAWSNFITGLDPGGHGIYDFIPRDPVKRLAAPTTSTVPTEADPIGLWGDWEIPWGGTSEPSRSGTPFWRILADHDVPADIWRMPANFPVEPAKGLSFPGMLTPALDSAYGQCTLYTTDVALKAENSYSKLELVNEYATGLLDTRLTGPPNGYKHGNPAASIPLKIHVNRARDAVAIEVGDPVVVLEPGQWSGFVRVTFDNLPMGLESISGIVRFYLRSIEPELTLYASPVNVDPTAPFQPVSEPESASADLARAIGLYYTQGMAEDVNSLKKRLLTDQEFMQQVELVYRERRDMFEYALDTYLSDEEGGLLFFYFSTVDLACHMMWRHGDPKHPAHDRALAEEDSSSWSGREGSRWKDTVYDLYMRMDPVLGRLRQRIGEDTTLIVMSDHGFAPYRRKFSLNTWLYENGYLVLQEGMDKEKPRDEEGFGVRNIGVAGVVDWTKTRAYGMGFNGLFLNLKGREKDDPRTPDVDETGIVEPGAEADALLAELKQKLEALRDPTMPSDFRPILRCDLASEVYSGPRVADAPDIVVGYNSGYGNSDPASEGRIPHNVFEDNTGGNFNGSHLMAPEVVSGVLISNRPVREGDHRLRDLTVELLRRYGIEKTKDMDGHPVLE